MRRSIYPSYAFVKRMAVGLGLAAALPAGAQVPVGSQFQVNTYTTSAQGIPSVGVDTDGDFVVVWTSDGSYGTDTSSASIQGQRYASNGSTQGSQFQINSYTTGIQTAPSVAADADGDFVVVWASAGSSGTDTDADSIQGQRYASNGSTQGSQFQINTYTTSVQKSPSVAAASDGDFVVVWQGSGSSGSDTNSYSIHGQRYASDGSAQGGEFQVNTYTTAGQFIPSVWVDTDGDFVVVWDSQGSAGTDPDNSIQGQRYSSNGSAVGTEFQVNSYTTSYQTGAFVASDLDGDFVVVWTSEGSSGTDTSFLSIQGQRYASDGSTQGGQFQVNTYTPAGQGSPSVATASDGGFVVAWGSDGSAGTDTDLSSVQGQRHAADGSATGPEFQVNSYTTGAQGNSLAYPVGVVAAAAGGFVVVWQSDGSPGTDTSGYSIQGQRYSLAAAEIPVPSMSPATRLALGAVLVLLGTAVARAYGSVSRRSRFSR